MARPHGRHYAVGIGLAALTIAVAARIAIAGVAQTTGAYPLPPPHPPEAQRTEEEARRVAERNRADREARRKAAGTSVELMIARAWRTGGSLSGTAEFARYG